MEQEINENTDCKESWDVQVYEIADRGENNEIENMETGMYSGGNGKMNNNEETENIVDLREDTEQDNSNEEQEKDYLLNGKNRGENSPNYNSLDNQHIDNDYVFNKSEIIVVATEDGDTESICIGKGNKSRCTCSSCCKTKKKKSFDTLRESRKVQKKEKKRQRARSRKKACISCCKKFTAFLFSHIGLMSLVVAYSILGGFIFRALESPYELRERENVENIRKSKVDRLWNLTKVLNIFDPGNWSNEADKLLRQFQKEIYTATKERGWDGGEGVDREADSQWSFAGSLLYSITVLTTIGYGHIAPKTEYGMLVTIVYALFGIPLTLLCLANIGSFFGDCFRLFYKHVCLAVIWLCCPSQAKWTSGPKPNRYSSKTINTDGSRNSLNLEKSLKSNKLESGSIDEQGDVIIKVEEVEIKRSKEYDVVRVPILVSLMLIALYIIAGAILFSTWEGWNYLEGSYFCFITLSTVGFGDYVPGASSDSLSNNEKLIICACYLFFGLAIIAMCFNLMQEEVRAKFVWLGRKIGIIEEGK